MTENIINLKNILYAGLLFIILPSGCIDFAIASPNNYLMGARFDAMANATVMIPDLWSISHNQAGLGWVTSPSAAFHFENKFVVPQYSLSGIGIVIPTKPGTMGVMLSYFGYSKYHETRFGLSFGRAFSEHFAAGIQLNYISTFVADEYGSYGSLVAEGGIIASPVKNLLIGAHIYNITRASMPNPEKDPIPTIFRLGLGYQLQKRIFISVETQKDLDKQAMFKTGLEVMAIDNLFLRAGYSTRPGKPSFGLGYLVKGFRGDIAFTLHPQLGFTPYFSLMYSF